MVSSARAPLHAGRLRALNAPRPVEVRFGPDGEPIAVRLRRGGDWHRVSVQDRWRIDDEWWREPIERHYYAVALTPLSGRSGDTGQLTRAGARSRPGEACAAALLTLFRDGQTGGWYVQSV